MRVFLAVFPPPETQARALGVIEALRRPGDMVSWVKRENLHYTLRFLGEIGEDGARRAADAAREAAAAHAAFAGVLAAPGAFPNARRARVLWLGMGEGADAFRALAHSLEDALARRGFEREGRPFAPHLTIGRVRADADWTAALAAVPPVDASFPIERIVVVKSTLSPRGSRYDVLAEAPLGVG